MLAKLFAVPSLILSSLPTAANTSHIHLSGNIYSGWFIPKEH